MYVTDTQMCLIKSLESVLGLSVLVCDALTKEKLSDCHVCYAGIDRIGNVRWWANVMSSTPRMNHRVKLMHIMPQISFEEGNCFIMYLFGYFKLFHSCT